MPRIVLLRIFALAAIVNLTAQIQAMEPINRIETDELVVALTFDDGPHEKQTLEYIELFKQEGVKATFFETGKSMAKNPGLVKKLAEAGHEIGNHTMTHPHLPELESIDAVREQLKGTQERVFKETGQRPKVFRAPYLEYDERVHTVLKELGMPAINASRSARDWSPEASVEVILQRTTENIKGGDILLMHSWPPNTLEAMPEIIRRLKAGGFRFVTVSELLAMDASPE